MILNLSLWFALHVLFGRVTALDSGPVSLPLPVLATLDPVALGLVALAAGLMLWARRGIGPTLGVMAAAGLLVGVL